MRPQAATTVRKTPNFDFIFGRYCHSDAVVPYFQISMSFNDVSRYLTLVSDMPGAASMNWRIEELFQREIDWWRVERKIIPYLKQQNEPQFFNSLTIALLPIAGDVVSPFGDNGPWVAPPLDNQDNFASGKVAHFGPITCGYWSSWQFTSDDTCRLGQLCWNTEQICAVAIDGQHRLAAIQELARPGGETYRKSNVPVILIVLDPKLGFVGGDNKERLIEVLRRLFIDLNKHAQKVNRARQILLDDRDPASICVRSLVGTELMRGINELRQDTPSLPLTLVDWHSEQAKFDTGPYLTTILGIDWVISQIIGIRPLDDPMAFDEIEKTLNRLETTLSIELKEAQTRLTDCRRYERPFGFVDEPVNELKLIGDGFVRKWSRAVLHLLTALNPYRDLIDLRNNSETLTPEFANWFALLSTAEDAGGAGRASQRLQEYQRHLSNRVADPISIADFTSALRNFDALKNARQLAFTVVFQRALFFAFLQFKSISQKMIDDLHPPVVADIQDALNVDLDFIDGNEDVVLPGIEDLRAKDIVAALNHIVFREPDFLKVDFEFVTDEKKQLFDRFWLCSFVHPSGPIDFTQGASKRASDWLLMIAIFWIYKHEERLEKDDFDSLLERVENAGSGVDIKLGQCLKRLYFIDQSVASRILKSRELEDDETLVLARQQIVCRARWIWSKIFAV